MLITTAVFIDRSIVKTSSIILPLKQTKILLHFLTDETLLFNREAVLGCLLMYL